MEGFERISVCVSLKKVLGELSFILKHVPHYVHDVTSCCSPFPWST